MPVMQGGRKPTCRSLINIVPVSIADSFRLDVFRDVNRLGGGLVAALLFVALFRREDLDGSISVLS